MHAAPSAGSVSTALSTGTRLDILKAMSTRIATAIDADSTPARDLAALTRRMIDISKEIESEEAAAAEKCESERKRASGDSALDPSTL